MAKRGPKIKCPLRLLQIGQTYVWQYNRRPDGSIPSWEHMIIRIRIARKTGLVLNVSHRNHHTLITRIA